MPNLMNVGLLFLGPMGDEDEAQQNPQNQKSDVHQVWHDEPPVFSRLRNPGSVLSLFGFTSKSPPEGPGKRHLRFRAYEL